MTLPEDKARSLNPPRWYGVWGEGQASGIQNSALADLLLCSQEKVRAGCWRTCPVSLLSRGKQSYLDSASDPLRKELKSSQWCWHVLGTVTRSFAWLGCSFSWFRGTWWWPCLAGWVTWFVPAVGGPQTLSPPCWASSGFQMSHMSKSNHVSPHAQGSGCRLCQLRSPRANPSWSTTCLLLPQRTGSV